MSATLLEIPVIDFAPFVSGDAAARQVVARQIHRACHDVGFLYLKNLNISPRLIETMFAQAEQFFALPLAIKNQVAWSDAVSNRGYVGIERERLDQDKPGDLKEAFNVGKEIDLEDFPPNQAALILNQWPAGQEVFRETVLAFYQACADAAATVCQAFAMALELPESFFAQNHDQQNYTMRLLHYPPVEQTPKPEQIRAGEHSDYGSFTLLFQDQVGGLEVCTTDGEWIAAPSIPGTVVVNTGDLMQQWTNHEFCSTKHRVRIPTDERLGQSRYSIAFFCHPNHDTEIACLETCQGPQRPPLYSPISAGEYLLSRLKATY